MLGVAPALVGEVITVGVAVTEQLSGQTRPGQAILACLFRHSSDFIYYKSTHPSPQAVWPLEQIGSSVLSSGLGTDSSTEMSQLLTLSDLKGYDTLLFISRKVR